MKDELRDQLRKLGLRVRPRTVERSSESKPGTVGFDERGDAKYEWKDESLAEDGERAERARNKALQYHGLALAEDEPPANAPIQHNAKGLRLGYNPYESGLLVKKERVKKRDLRELSKWVEMKRKLKDGP